MTQDATADLPARADDTDAAHTDDGADASTPWPHHPLFATVLDLAARAWGPKTAFAWAVDMVGVCPFCDTDLHVISDPYSGYADNITNIDEVFADLAQAGDLKSRAYAGENGVLSEPRPVAETFCQEGSCRECDFSMRAYLPRRLLAASAFYQATHG